jgi:hypothetical protein
MMAEKRRATVLAWGLGVFAAAWVWTAVLAHVGAPIGPSDEHLDLGRRLYRTGSLSTTTDPGVLRPPGYLAFIAATLHLRDAWTALRGLPSDQAPTDEQAVLQAQSVVGAAAAVFVFAFAVSLVPPFEAACAALVLAWGPVALPMVGVWSYPTLHVALVAFATAHLDHAVRAAPRKPLGPLLAGVSWGLVTLVRPVTLILPPFVYLMARRPGDRSRKSAALVALLFAAGMALAILPYTVRNYLATRRVVLVNAQDGFALWAATARRFEPQEEFLSWGSLWGERGMIIYRRVTRRPEYDLETFSAHVLELNDAFRDQALRNLRRRPGVYVANVATNLSVFCRDPMDRWPISLANANQRDVRRAERVATAYAAALMLLALVGVVVGVRRGDGAAWTVLLVFVTMALSHALTYLNARYTYVKLPLLAMALPFCFAALADRSVPGRRGPSGVRLSSVLAATVLALTAASTLMLLLPAAG